MYFLLEACEHPDVLRVLFFATEFLDILFVVLPIGLILMLMIDFTKAVVVNKEEEQIKSTKLVVKRIMYAVLVFAVPWIVNFVMDVLESVDLGVDYIDCINNANSDTIAYYDKKLEEQEKMEKMERAKDILEDYRKKLDKSYDNKKQTASGATFSESAASMLNLARGELGHVGGEKYCGSDVPWCAYFVMWNLKNTTINGVGTVYDVITKEGGITEGEGYAGSMIPIFSRHSNLEFHYSSHYGGKYVPKKGDIIFFWYKSRNEGQYWDKSISKSIYADHIGIVDYSSDGMVHTIEGNANNKVSSISYYLSDDTIMGYGSWYKN